MWENEPNIPALLISTSTPFCCDFSTTSTAAWQQFDRYRRSAEDRHKVVRKPIIAGGQKLTGDMYRTDLDGSNVCQIKLDNMQTVAMLFG